MSHAIAFDILGYEHKLKEAGVPEKQAEIQAHALVEIVENNLATKQDIELIRSEMGTKLELEKAKTEIIKWCVGAVFAAVGLFATIMKLLG